MKNNISLFICMISVLLLTACYNATNHVNNTEKEKLHALLIQALPQCDLLSTAIASITEPINDIIKETIGLNQKTEFDFFIPKQALRLTLYYVNSVTEDNDNIILSALDEISFHPLNNASIAPIVNFFYGQLEEKDELVVMINDQGHELNQLNNHIKTALHKAKQLHHSLYNQEKSEQYEYIPHIGLGRIRTTSIKNHLKDPSQFTEMFTIIQKKIKDFVESFLQKHLDQHNNKLIINNFGILDLNKKIYIKEI